MTLFKQYLEPTEGFWGPPTSTIDWCEENYVVSFFIAEFINTLSNSFFILLAVYAMSSSIKNRFELRFTLISFGFALVGIGSWLFHMTLKYEYQLLDELPMIYATCIPLWSVFSEDKSQSMSWAIGWSIVIGSNLLTAIYLHFKDPTIHQVAYALINVLIIIRSHLLTLKYVKNEADRKRLFKIMVSGVATFLTGYFLWNLDVHFCSSWIGIRRVLGIPLGFLFELHGWWHILTGTGVYYYVVYLEYLRLFIIKRENEYLYIERFGFLPDLMAKNKGNERKKE